MRANMVFCVFLLACGQGVASTDALTTDGPAAARVELCGTVLTSDTRLTEDIGPCPGDAILIGADDVELDCNGHTIRGTGDGAGVQAVGFDDVQIRNCRIDGFEQHVYLEDAVGGKIEDNRMIGPIGSTGAPNCIWLRTSRGVEIEDNRLRECRMFVEESHENAIIGNTMIDGDVPLFMVRSSLNLVAANTIRRCVENTLIDVRSSDFFYNVVVGCQSGFLLEELVRGNRFFENELRNNERGFFVLGSGGNAFDDNDVFGNDIGFRIRDTEAGLYVDNEVRGNGIGFSLDDADANVFERNDVTDNLGDGFEITNADANTFSENQSDRNGGAGFRLVNSNDNALLDNEACDNVGGDIVIEKDSFGNELSGNDFCETDEL